MCCFGRKRCWVLIGGLLLLTGTSDFFISIMHISFIINYSMLRCGLLFKVYARTK